MDFFAWLEVAIAIGLACLPVMRHWRARPAPPQYLGIWVNAKFFRHNAIQQRRWYR